MGSSSDGKHGLYFETRWGVHTFGMKFPLDIIVLNNKWEVAKIRRGLLPNRLFFWNPKHKRVIELPSEMQASMPAPGDRVLIN